MRDLPAPWQRGGVSAIGGLTEIGFDSTGCFLLVVSHQGRGVYGVPSFERIARDDSDIRESDWNERNQTMKGIGPLAGVDVHVVDLWGGSLLTETQDNWAVVCRDLDTVRISGPNDTTVELDDFASEIRAAGFSPDGKVFLLATSSDFTFYRR